MMIWSDSALDSIVSGGNDDCPFNSRVQKMNVRSQHEDAHSPGLQCDLTLSYAPRTTIRQGIAKV